MKKHYFVIILPILFMGTFCTKIGLQLDNNIVTPISVVGNVSNMVLDSLNPLKICISSSIRAKGISYTWAYTSTDGGFFYKDSLMQEKILPNIYTSAQREDTQLVYYVPKQFSVNGVRNSLSFFVKNTFNPTQILTYTIRANVSEAPSDKPVIIAPKDSTLQDNNDNNNGNNDYVDPNDPNTDWNVFGKRDTVGVGDFVYILGRNFNAFVNATNTTIRINGRTINWNGNGVDSIQVIADTAVRIVVPPNLYDHFIDTMKINLAMSISLPTGEVVSADFTGSPYSPVWKPTYFVTPFNTTINNPNDMAIDTNNNLMYICSISSSIYNTINLTTPTTTADHTYGTAINNPFSIALDDNNIYIANYNPTNGEIFKIQKSVNNTAELYLTGLRNPFDILISNDKNTLFVYNENPSLLYQTNVAIASTNVNTLTPLFTLTQGNNLPAGIAINKKNELFVAFQSNHTILKIMPDGSQSIIAGNTNTAGYAGDKVDASLSVLNMPYKILSDNYNSLFFTDKQNQAIRVISNFTNRIYTIGGNPINTSILTPINNANNIKANLVLFDNATSITMDKENNIYIINDNIYKLELR